PGARLAGRRVLAGRGGGRGGQAPRGAGPGTVPALQPSSRALDVALFRNNPEAQLWRTLRLRVGSTRRARPRWPCPCIARSISRRKTRLSQKFIASPAARSENEAGIGKGVSKTRVASVWGGRHDRRERSLISSECSPQPSAIGHETMRGQLPE